MEELEVIQKEESLKLRVADLLKETVRLAGELRVNAMVLENENIKALFVKGSTELAEFNKELSEISADLNK